MKKVLLFNTPDVVKKLFCFFNLEIIEVNQNDYSQQLGYILKLDGYNHNDFVSNQLIDEPMIVFYELSETDLDNVLSILKTSQIKIDLKAIVTEYNINWPAVMLYDELKKERLTIKKNS